MKRQDSGYVQVLLRQARLEGGDDLAGTGIVKTKVTCRAPECGRHFFGLHALQEHAESVHTFDDIRQILNEFVREKFGRPGTNSKPGIYVWVNDIAEDWVVWSVEDAKDCALYKATYAIDADNKVTLGTPAEVVRRTVYDPVKKD